MIRVARLLVLLLVGASSIAIQAQTAPTAVLTVPASLGFGLNLTASGTQSSAAPGRTITQYQWRLDGGAPIATAVPTYTFVAGLAQPIPLGRRSVELVVVDDAGNRSAATTRDVIVFDAIAPTAVIDLPPVVGVGDDVPVSGARSFDVGGAVRQYRWQLDGGLPFVTDVPTFTFDVDPVAPLALGRHTVQLIVTDDSGNRSSPDAAQFVVVDTLAPTAVLDVPAWVGVGQSFVVSGARSFDIGGSVRTYIWTIDGQPPVNTDVPTFTVVVDPASPLALGTHIVQLEVVDDGGNRSAAALAAVIVVDSQIPTAVVTAPPTVVVGQSFSVSGAQSFDADGTIVRYQWTLDTQPVVVTDYPVFTIHVDPAAPLPVGRHTIQLEVVDDSGNRSRPDVAQFIVVDTLAPAAVVDVPRFVRYGDPITASGARSFDVGGLVRQWAWRLDGGNVIASDQPAVAFAVDPAAPFAPGLHLVELVVTDDSGNQSQPATAQVRVTDGVAPTAVLTVPPIVPVGQSVTVSGAQSFDLGGRVVRYEWMLDAQPPIVTEGPSLTFVVDPAAPLAVGRHTVQLVVTDDSGNDSQPDLAQFIVVDNIAPTAVIDMPTSLPPGQPLLVSGARSFDVGGRVIRYVWTLDGGFPIATEDSAIVFGQTAALAVGRHHVQLEVTDDSGNRSQPVSAAVDVLPPPDVTAPTITLTTPPQGAVYSLSQAIAANYICTDGDSGVASCAGPVASGANIDTSTVGVKTFRVTAIDVAGNQAQVPHTYSVGYVFTGFFSPVDNLPVINTGKAGRTIPLKWRLADGAGRPVRARASFVSLRHAAVACDASPDAVLEAQLAPTTASALHYDAAADQFVYHWRTVKGVVGCRMVQLTLADGSAHYAKFRLR